MQMICFDSRRTTFDYYLELPLNHKMQTKDQKKNWTK